MVIGAKAGDRYDEHTMIFAGITAYDAGATVGTLSIGADVFALGGLIEVRHEAAVKLEVTHALLMYEPHSSRSAVCRVVAGV